MTQDKMRAEKISREDSLFTCEKDQAGMVEVERDLTVLAVYFKGTTENR